MTLFDHLNIDLGFLKKNAFNQRWASVPTGVIPLTSADSDFPVSQEISKKLHEYVDKGYFPYGPSDAYSAFKEALAEKYRRKNVAIQSEYVMATNSAAHALRICCEAFIKPGDEAIIMEPVDFLFRYNIEKVGGITKSIEIPIDPSKTLNIAHLKEIVTDKTKVLFLCNPHNPTGKVFTAEELKLLADVIVENNLIVVSDEIWSDIVFPPNVHVSIASINMKVLERTVIVTGFSKSYGLAGLRIGALLAGSADLYKRLFISSDHDSTVNGGNVFGQIAAIAALNEANDWLSEYLIHLKNMRDLTVSKLNSIEGVTCFEPMGCFVAFANIEQTGLTSQQVTDKLLNEGKVAVVPGQAKWFGEPAEGHIRVSFSTSVKILTVALNRIKRTIDKI